jgi:hypothetical protein
MKTPRLLCLLLLGGLTTQCASSPEPAPAPTYDERSTALLKEVAPQVVGQWTLAEVRYTRRQFFQYPPSLPRDTVLSQFATLTIGPAPIPRPSRAGIPEFEGQLTYHRKTYPVRFALLASPERVVRQQGPPAYFLLEYNFPVGSHQTEPEEQFLQDIGLVGENFSLEVEAGQATMRWQGLNRHLTAITLRK